MHSSTDYHSTSLLTTKHLPGDYLPTGFASTQSTSTESLYTVSCGTRCSVSPSADKKESATYQKEFPWHVMFCSSSTGYLCSGVVVGCNCVITAASCVLQDGAPVENITVCVGQYCGNSSKSGVSRCYEPVIVKTHKDYDPVTLDHNLAMVKLRNALLCSCETAMPVCLPNRTLSEFAVMPASLTGWHNSRRLRKSDVRLITRDPACKLSNLTYRVDGNSVIAGSCAADTGGPIVLQSMEINSIVQHFLIGIVSLPLATGCGTARESGVYTSVSSHLDWVNQACNK
jgi:hypothetical protein